MDRRRTTFALAAGLLLAGLAGVAVYRIWPTLNPDIMAMAPLDPDCDLRAGPCIVQFADGARVGFGIEPRDIPVVRLLVLEVNLEGIRASQVEVDFQGTDMNMGYNRSELEAVKEGRFVGKGMLPVCVRYAMEWEARVLLHTEHGLLAAPFRFITVTPRGEAPRGVDPIGRHFHCWLLPDSRSAEFRAMTAPDGRGDGVCNALFFVD
jgi:hypothetical protein